MAKRVKDTGGEMTISLHDPGMTSYHKAGLAGLWMTLEVLGQEKHKAARQALEAAGGSWTLDKSAVTLRWSDPAFWRALFLFAFQLDEQGVMYFPGLGSVPMDHPEHAAALQNAVLGTLLQHGQTRKFRDKDYSPLLYTDENELEQKTEPIRRMSFYKLQDQSLSPKAKSDVASFEPYRTEKLSGTDLPGGAVRHVGLSAASALTDPPGRRLALRFLAIGSLFFRVRQNREGIKPLYVLVIPVLENLDMYALLRREVIPRGVEFFSVSGKAEAALRVLQALDQGSGLPDCLDVPMCRVYPFGVVPWSSQQKSRIRSMVVQVRDPSVLRTYRLVKSAFEPRRVETKSGESFLVLSQSSEWIADNLVRGRPWWHGFSRYILNPVNRESVFRYERKGLSLMVREEIQGECKLFVRSCHDAWRKVLARLAGRAKSQGFSFYALADKEAMKWRIAFARCRNAKNMRSAITDFWSCTGSPLQTLVEHWERVLPLLVEERWREAQDLSLLALASYSPPSR